MITGSPLRSEQWLAVPMYGFVRQSVPSLKMKLAVQPYGATMQPLALTPGRLEARALGVQVLLGHLDALGPCSVDLARKESVSQDGAGLRSVCVSLAEADGASRARPSTTTKDEQPP